MAWSYAFAGKRDSSPPLFSLTTIMVMMSDGIVRRLNKDPDLIKHGWPEDEDDQDYVYPVGPDSPHPLLNKLEW